MATGGPKYNLSVKTQKRMINKRSSDEGQSAVKCWCRAGKKTLCQYCTKSPKKIKLLEGEIFRPFVFVVSALLLFT